MTFKLECMNQIYILTVSNIINANLRDLQHIIGT